MNDFEPDALAARPFIKVLTLASPCITSGDRMD